MYVRAAVAERLLPRMIGPNATRDWLFWLDYDLTPADGAERFAMGTPNVVGMFGAVESLALLRELDPDLIDQHVTGLAAEAIEGLAGLGYHVVTPREEHSGIVTFRTERSKEDSAAWLGQLAERRSYLALHLDKAALPHLRLSFHCYNTRQEVHQFLNMLERVQS
ncbi:MAG: aminotransferase class V-fold PLP-dependent enzyme [Anaerolineae bacterium]|nr:aminotransferase class V-fold PLP-dependent enzyme [Anaerolineae bacterium]